MVSSIRRVINVSTDEVYGEGSFGAAEGEPRHLWPGIQKPQMIIILTPNRAITPQ